MEELSLNILDIAQNSVRANATRVDITVAELPAEDRLVITINDNGCGMTPGTGRPCGGPVLHHPHHPQGGAGSSLFQNGRADDRRGFLHSIAGGQGHPVRAVFGLTHIDRMPLGNMADTMCILMGCNEQINFSFTYQVGEAVFTVSTAQLQEILDGVPLNTPQVMDFIRGYIKENMDLLSGGAS